MDGNVLFRCACVVVIIILRSTGGTDPKMSIPHVILSIIVWNFSDILMTLLHSYLFLFKIIKDGILFNYFGKTYRRRISATRWGEKHRPPLIVIIEKIIRSEKDLEQVRWTFEGKFRVKIGLDKCTITNLNEAIPEDCSPTWWTSAWRKAKSHRGFSHWSQSHWILQSTKDLA